MLTIFGQKSNDTNNCPYFLETKCILKLDYIAAYVCLESPQEKMFRKNINPHLSLIRVICNIRYE